MIDKQAVKRWTWKNVGLWLLQVALAAFILMSGVFKLIGAPEMIAVFDAVGGGQWFRYLTGVLELLGAVLLLIPSLTGLGALLLAAVLLGASFTELLLLDGNPLLPLTLLGIGLLIALGRRERTATLLRSMRH